MVVCACMNVYVWTAGTVCGGWVGMEGLTYGAHTERGVGPPSNTVRNGDFFSGFYVPGCPNGVHGVQCNET